MSRPRFLYGLLTLAVVATVATAPVLAQEQVASLEGVVTDTSGAPLPGALVRVTGPRLPSGATATADTRGRYRFPSLPSGTYKVTAELDQFATAEIEDVRLALGDLLTLDVNLELAAVAETISVTSDAPLIEITQSATSASISDELIHKLPRGRSFESVITQAAHAADEGRAGGISIDGASGSENRFVVDGIDTTNLQDGTNAKAVLTDFVQEVQVKSSGYNAEFGGSTGGVINVVTRTGTNAFAGDVGVYYDKRSWDGDARPSLRLDPEDGERFEYVTFPEDDQDRLEPGFTLGGPIAKDKLWFFAAYKIGRAHV